MKIRFAALALIAILMARPVFAADQVNPTRLISEAAIRAVSDAVYTELIRQALKKGWQFSSEQIERGYERHFDEIKRQLVDRGYVLVVGEVGV